MDTALVRAHGAPSVREVLQDRPTNQPVHKLRYALPPAWARRQRAAHSRLEAPMEHLRLHTGRPPCHVPPRQRPVGV
eukprot:3117318-Rhodomonas_salina.1